MSSSETSEGAFEEEREEEPGERLYGRLEEEELGLGWRAARGVGRSTREDTGYWCARDGERDWE
jgi:hypothetical protein